MKLADSGWAVVECKHCKKHHCFYEDTTDEDMDCLCGSDGFSDVLPNNWTSEDCVTICENELENANRHTIIDLPRQIHDSLDNVIKDRELFKEVIQVVMGEIYDIV